MAKQLHRLRLIGIMIIEKGQGICILIHRLDLSEILIIGEKDILLQQYRLEAVPKNLLKAAPKTPAKKKGYPNIYIQPICQRIYMML